MCMTGFGTNPIQFLFHVCMTGFGTNPIQFFLHVCTTGFGTNFFVPTVTVLHVVEFALNTRKFTQG